MNRFAIEKKTPEGWVNLAEWCEDIPSYYNHLPSAVEDFERYIDYMNDGCHEVTCRIVAIRLHRMSVIMTASTF